MRPHVFAVAAAAFVAAPLARAGVATQLPSQSTNLADQIGSSHWQPCYYMNKSLPSTIDGAVALSGVGTRAIKLSMNGASAYAWNSPAWPSSGFNSLLQTAQHPYYAGVFSNSYGTDYSTFVLVAYSTGPQYNGSVCQWYGPSAAAEDTRQFAELTQYLMATYGGKGYRFVLQSWENDWYSRCGSYNASQPADPAVQARVVQWLQARQDGVTAGRVAYCRVHLAGALDCGDPAAAHAIHAAAGVEVYHAAEVNLVLSSMETGFPNNILKVIPRVALDMVSYSSYDCMALPSFGDCLDFIAAHHNATPAAPSPAIAIGEYGIAENKHPPGTIQAVAQNVMAYAFSKNAAGVQRAAYAMFWELMDNECPSFPGQRCTAATGPQFNASELAGFWLVKPDGSHGWAYGYLQGLINGSTPLPTPPTGL